MREKHRKRVEYMSLLYRLCNLYVRHIDMTSVRNDRRDTSLAPSGNIKSSPMRVYLVELKIERLCLLTNE